MHRQQASSGNFMERSNVLGRTEVEAEIGCVNADRECVVVGTVVHQEPETFETKPVRRTHALQRVLHFNCASLVFLFLLPHRRVVANGANGAQRVATARWAVAD